MKPAVRALLRRIPQTQDFYETFLADLPFVSERLKDELEEFCITLPAPRIESRYNELTKNMEFAVYFEKWPFDESLDAAS